MSCKEKSLHRFSDPGLIPRLASQQSHVCGVDSLQTQLLSLYPFKWRKDKKLLVKELKLFRRYGAYHVFYLFNPVGRKSTLISMLFKNFFIRCIIHTIDLVFRNITFHPLDRRPEFPYYSAWFLRNSMKFFSAELAGTGQLSFNNITWQSFEF